MRNDTCAFCGTKVTTPASSVGIEAPPVRYCSLGCALRARLPVDDSGNFPANRYLAAALAVVFLYFNQLLCWGMHVLASRQDRIPLAAGFERAGLGSALLVFFGVVLCQIFTRTFRPKEWLISAVSFALLGRAVAAMPRSEMVAAFATGILLAWAGRGIFRSTAKV